MHIIWHRNIIANSHLHTCIHSAKMGMRPNLEKYLLTIVSRIYNCIVRIMCLREFPHYLFANCTKCLKCGDNHYYAHIYS